MNTTERKAVVLCLHGITPDAPEVTFDQLMTDPKSINPNANVENFQLKHVTESMLREYLNAIAQTGVPISLREMVKYLNSNTETDDDRTRFAITIDDSYRGVLSYGLPILEEFEFPATMFVTTGFVGTDRMYWTDQLEHMINYSQKEELRIQDPLNQMLCFEIASAQMKMHAILELKRYLKTKPLHEQARILAIVEQELGFKEALRSQKTSNLSFEDLRKLHAHPLIEIGAHSVNHPVLPTLSKFAQRYEIQASLAFLQNVLSAEIDLFSFPEGLFNDHTIDLLREERVTISPTAEPGINLNNVDPLQGIKRVMVGFNNQPLLLG